MKERPKKINLKLIKTEMAKHISILIVGPRGQIFNTTLYRNSNVTLILCNFQLSPSDSCIPKHFKYAPLSATCHPQKHIQMCPRA